MTNFEINQFADTASTITMQAAVDFVLQVAPGKAQLMVADDALVVLIRAKLHEQLDAALDDAKAATEAGMHQVADVTFGASMVQIGIDAAKAWLAHLALVVSK